MSKYTEAETKIKKIMCEEIDRLPSHFDGEDEVYDSTKDVDEILKLNKTICKALRIADRIEQADAREDVGKRLGEMEEWVRVSTNEYSYFKGYAQALTDIRGDNK